ncbi:hypothetical protein [Pseudomonas syringae]|uniref:Uncharacterized protein n=1 Tax=Pseudomonas syringae TaxID=317 RepID=A0AB38C1U2_PSESX|nr:hypothetical protein [Pseudomonas syringae]MCK0551329.1 hypothetical protein [Pseudomonas syringae pv. aptata]SFO57925.1 hypothetical protein SAMN05444065_1387 [Pseudomonas syringae]SFP06911.1 hypothetical protein SAMN05444063_1517 [Pseudomonas syringae]
MTNEVKWTIKKADGKWLQSFAIEPQEIHVGWFNPDETGKTKEGRKDPLALRDQTRALALLAALAANLPSEFLHTEVVCASAMERLASR